MLQRLTTAFLVFLCSFFLACAHHRSIDITKVPGIDCTGTSDSSAGLNAMLSNISNKQVAWADSCTVRTDHQVQIQGQISWQIVGETFQPTTMKGSILFGCGTDTGSLLYLNRDAYFKISNLGVFTKGNCASGFTTAIATDNLANGVGSNGTPTSGHFEGMSAMSNSSGAQVPGFKGFYIGGTPNNENVQVRESLVECQASPHSVAIEWDGYNADHGMIQANRLNDCAVGVKVSHGVGLTIEGNFIGSVGGFSKYGDEGGVIDLFHCGGSDVTTIAHNEASDGGPFINSGIGQPGLGCEAILVEGNTIGDCDIRQTPPSYVIDTGAPGAVRLTLIGNRVFTCGNLSATVVGSYIDLPHPPLGMLLDFGTVTDTGLGVTSSGQFQQGEFHAVQFLQPCLPAIVVYPCRAQ